MARKTRPDESKHTYYVYATIAIIITASVGALLVYMSLVFAEQVTYLAKPLPPAPPRLDKRAYDARMLALSHAASTTATSTAALWPVHAVYPKVGAILPFKRVVAYYGNFLSKGMGVLGEYPTEEMLAKLDAEVARWNAADPTTPVIPAIDYIAVTAQAAAGRDGMYRAQMSDAQIDHAVALADRIHGIVILDVQVGLSTLQKELPELAKYLARPNVHLAIDPEFSMTHGEKPGSVIGTFDAADVNYTARFLADLVQKNDLPPKILVIHRFTGDMLTHANRITPLPEVQMVIDMDGWGDPAKKKGTYERVVTEDPVQFAGLKLFYKNDLRAPSTRLLTPREILDLMPAPVFIQYQ